MTAFVPTLRPVLKEPYYGNEYHFQDRQTYRPLEARLRVSSFLQHIEVPESINPRDWNVCPFTEEIKQILTPQDGRVAYVPFGSWANWRPLTIIKKTTPDGHITYKVAIQKKDTGEVLMFFAKNDHAGGKNKPSMVDGWFVFHADMVAPTLFWNDLKARL